MLEYPLCLKEPGNQKNEKEKENTASLKGCLLNWVKKPLKDVA